MFIKKRKKSWLLYAWTPFPTDVEASTKATIELSSTFWSLILTHLVVGSAITAGDVATNHRLATTSEISDTLAEFSNEFKNEIRRITISVTSLTLKCKLLQKEIVSILQEKNKKSLSTLTYSIGRYAKSVNRVRSRRRVYKKVMKRNFFFFSLSSSGGRRNEAYGPSCTCRDAYI